ncbi:PPOX class F420-dependent oxidoreductase [Saccharothrix sp. S26]|uniref:PPOX class F420-dependent oxidoreductase n=1 Tax=Saccharothrix sp. S26 TaxID=2907215 RepID=UPI001F3575EC|nr:PPOX class F420-dependent oxidoreductase [Saccharothrix sp. S26]MCE6996350.1 PPOX class F420-dependent oxidoreductase [Saccharothrix sp. S26]
MPTIPDSHLDLLERPLFGHFATLGRSGEPNVNPIWFRWDGEYCWFTTSTRRRKHSNVRRDSRAALAVHDPESPYRYLELRGRVERVEPDPGVELFLALAARYGIPDAGIPDDAADRVRLGLKPTHITFQ